MALAALRELPGFPSHQRAGEMLLRKYNRDHAIDNAVRYPTETLQRFALPSIRRLDGWSH